MQGPDGIDTACVNMNILKVQMDSAKILSDEKSDVVSSWSSVTVYTVPWEELDKNQPFFSSKIEPSIREAVDRAALTMTRDLGCKGPVHAYFLSSLACIL
jgi:hypothetical protein